jgi:phosphomevalonate kinase
MLNLTDTTFKIGELNLDKAQFNLPKKVVILNARIVYKYYEVNGEKVKSDEITKIVCNVQDADKVKVLKEMNIAIEDLKAVTLEIYDNLDKMTKLAENDGLLDKTVELINPQVRLLWNMSRSSWSGVKLVTDDLKVLGE